MDFFFTVGLTTLYVELQRSCFGREALAVVAGLVFHIAVDAQGAERGRFRNAHLGRDREVSRVDVELVIAHEGQRQLLAFRVLDVHDHDSLRRVEVNHGGQQQFVVGLVGVDVESPVDLQRDIRAEPCRLGRRRRCRWARP